MFPRRDPNLLSQYLCRFCGERIRWGVIMRVLRVDPDTPGFLPGTGRWQTPQAADGGGSRHAQRLWRTPSTILRMVPLPVPGRIGVELTFHRHWAGRAPMPDDGGDIDGRPCAICAGAIAPPDLVRLRLQRPAGTVRKPEFDEQSLPPDQVSLRESFASRGRLNHFECLAAVSRSRLS
jgi:hypothetical protein